MGVSDSCVLGLLGEGREINNKTALSSFCPASLVSFSSLWSSLRLSPEPTSTLETKSALCVTWVVQAKKPTGENVEQGGVGPQVISGF